VSAYLDTSVLVALFFREPGSVGAQRRIGQEAEPLLSRWALAEFASAAAFKVRVGHTTETTAREAARRLVRLVDDRALTLIELERDDFAACARLCAAHASGLRTPDALHCAIAARWRVPLLTFDDGQARGCAHHGIEHELLLTG
jgi:uncharacterized protein